MGGKWGSWDSKVGCFFKIGGDGREIRRLVWEGVSGGSVCFLMEYIWVGG